MKYRYIEVEKHSAGDRKGRSIVFLECQSGCKLYQSIFSNYHIIKTHQYGLRTALHGGLQVTGSYNTGGRSSLCLRGVYKADIGTTVRVASTRDEGQTFHDRRMPRERRQRIRRIKISCSPSRSSTSSKFMILVN